jgi:para-aminobenzoate synthetase component 1
MGDRLELHEHVDAFRRLESWLAARGFFAAGGEQLVADLYLGYGLSQAIRRRRTAAPPEPCRLPLLACAVRSGRYAVGNEDNGSTSSEGFRVGEWSATWQPAAYAAAVECVREAIGRGDVYQVNLVQHLSAPFDAAVFDEAGTGEAGSDEAGSDEAGSDEAGSGGASLAGAAAALAAALSPLDPLIPGPLVGDGWAVVSASPELFLARRGRRIWTMPIKGTRPAGSGAELEGSEKDAAEHVMIVDLERNDLSRVSVAGSVRWPELMAWRSLAGVEHLVSRVEGVLEDDVGLAELLEATFPGGSVTGAPKIAAVDLIAELEPVGRGASMGAIGRVHGNGDLDLALTIRTFAIADDHIHLWVGGGIVWDSDPASEVEESWTKARPLLAAIGAPYAPAVVR